MADDVPDARKGDRRKGDDGSYRGEERRKGDRRGVPADPPPPRD